MDNHILKTIADNPALLEALRALLERQFEAPREIKSLPLEVSDELLGQFLRARMVGLKAVDEAFNEIAKYKSVPDQPERINQAR